MDEKEKSETLSMIVFLDTETTSLRYDRRAWEVGLVVPGRGESHWFVDAADLDLGEADLKSLAIGGFYERHPSMSLQRARYEVEAASERDMLTAVEMLTRGAHIAGMVPNFDTETLAARMRWHGICPSWHYHLIDVKSYAAGCLASREAGDGVIGLPPWDSEELSAAVGVNPDHFDRHTALGDARWAQAVYNAVTAGPNAKNAPHRPAPPLA